MSLLSENYMSSNIHKMINLTLVPCLATTVTSMSLYLPCVRELRSTPFHGEWHRVVKEGEQGWEQRRGRRGNARGGETGPGTLKGGGRRERGGQKGPETKKRPLVEDVSQYQESYEGGGTN